MLSVLAFFLRAFLEIILAFFADAYDCHNRHYEKFADGRVKDIEDEIPFAVPEGWAWCRLGEIGKFISRGKTPVYTKESQYPVLAQKCNQWQGIILDNALFLDPNSLSKWTNDHHLQHEDIVINSTGTGTIGRVGIFDIGILGKYPFIVPDSHISVVRCYKTYICQKYIYNVFRSGYLQNQINEVATGSTNQKELPKKALFEFLLPLPPLSEQQRIVAKIETIFAQIDLLEQNKVDLQTAIKQAKSKILDLAIHGKLVPQDPADEPASVMLEKLRAEKEAKIAAGEIKRGKNDSYIYKNSTDSCYYEKFDDGTEVAIEIDSIIPDAWVWCYFTDIADVINGKNQSKVKEGAGKYPIYGSGGIIGYANDYICPENCTIIGRKGSINNPIFTEEKFWNVDTAFGLIPSSIILPRYLFYFCKSFDFTSLDSSTTLPSLTKTNIQHILFPLPPFAAQQRILDKIDELFNQLDKIALNIV